MKKKNIAIILVALIVLLIPLQFKYLHLYTLKSFSKSDFSTIQSHILLYSPENGIARIAVYDELFGESKRNIPLEFISPTSANYKITKLSTAGDYFLQYYFDKDTLVNEGILIDGVDTESLKGLGHCSGDFGEITVDFCYIEDKQGIHFVKVDYSIGIDLKKAELVTLKKEKSDSAKFTDLGMGYAVYGNTSYYMGKRMSTNIELKSFEPLFVKEYINSENHFGGGNGRVKQFTTYAFDSEQLFYGEGVIGDTEEKECSLDVVQKVKSNYNLDLLIGCLGVYYKGTRVENVRAATVTFFPIEKYQRANSSYAAIWRGENFIYCGSSEIYNLDVASGKTVITDITTPLLNSEGRKLFNVFDRGRNQEIVRFECNEGNLENVVYVF
ncbi:MAG: hypothetical protein Fur003_4280 [Candidatus Dojkabacteria bacterium]